MTHLRKGVLLAAFVALFLSGTAANAQMDCSQCDPQASYCSESCWYCQTPHPDGYCNQYDVVYSTCGDYMGACLEDNCSPNWVTTDRTNVGTYGETTYGFTCSWQGCFPTFGCEHHRVDRVTQVDTNECNISSSYNTRVFCHDWVDGSIPHQQGSIPNCCSYYSGWSCNDWHSCF